MWKDPRLLEALQAFVARGGGFLGVGEPGAVRDGMRHFAPADVLGVDQEVGLTTCFEKYPACPCDMPELTKDLSAAPKFHNAVSGVYPLGPETKTVLADDAGVVLAAHDFGKGRAVYLNGFTYSPENARLLYRVLFYLAGKADAENYLPDDPRCEAAVFPDAGKIVIINNGTKPVSTALSGNGKRYKADLPAEGCVILDL